MQEFKYNNARDLSGGYFGKLPMFADFVKHNAAGSEILGFDKWIQEGITKLKFTARNGWEKFYNESTCFQFLYNDNASKNFLAGNMYPGSDKSGRKFPFLLFLKSGNTSDFTKEFHLIPLLLSYLFENAEPVYEKIKAGTNAAEINSVLEDIIKESGNGGDPSADFENYISSNRILNFTERTFLSQVNGRELSELMNAAVTKGSNLIKPFTLKIPLSKESDSLPYEVSFWIKSFGKKINTATSSFFWTCPKSGPDSAMFIFCGRIVPRNFVDLFYPLNKSEELIDVADLLSSLNEGKNIPASSGEDYTMKEFLENIL